MPAGPHALFVMAWSQNPGAIFWSTPAEEFSAGILFTCVFWPVSVSWEPKASRTVTSPVFTIRVYKICIKTDLTQCVCGLWWPLLLPLSFFRRFQEALETLPHAVTAPWNSRPFTKWSEVLGKNRVTVKPRCVVLGVTSYYLGEDPFKTLTLR